MSITRDDSDNFGHYFHGHITITFPDQAGSAVLFEAAVDVNKPDKVVEFSYAKDLDPTPLKNLTTATGGYRELVKSPASGALDYKRAPLVNRSVGCLLTVLSAFKHKKMEWKQNVGTSALERLESLFVGREAQIQRVWLFGAAYEHLPQVAPSGVHDVHCNQGDPPGSFQHLDGIWQDGGVVVRYVDAHWEGFFVKFATQTLETDT